jgi:hypothetical protein
MYRWRLAVLCFIAGGFLVAGCNGGSEIDCEGDDLYDPLTEECIPRFPGEDTGGADATSDAGDTSSDGTSDDAGDASEEDTTSDDAGDGQTSDDAGDTEADGDDTGPGSECDKDFDGALAESCGGNDCDDNDRRRAPGYTEFCDNIDNNCSGQVNDNITCTFYAHSGNELYEVDPFKKTASRVSATFGGGQNGNASLLDLDTHSSGTLFGISYDGLYRYDEWAESWIHVGDYGIDIGGPFGLAIDSDDVAYIISEDKVYTVDLRSGRASLLGNMQGDFYASGDCVVNKRDTLFMTSKHDETQDHLVSLSKQTGAGTEIGPIGYKDVFGLTSAWGNLYGLTRDGELISIDYADGQSTLLHTFSIEWFGAASTPNR